MEEKLVSDNGHIVERRGLRDRILQAMAICPLTLVIAPPVSGKTTLLAQIATDLRERGEDCAVTLPEAEESRHVAILHYEKEGLRHAPDFLADLERRIAAGQRFLIAADRPLEQGLAVLRLRGGIRQLGMADIALDDADLPGFLGSAFVEGRPGRPLRLLQEKTEGWIGAWSLLRTLLAEGYSLADLARNFSGADRDLVTYFESVVLPGCDDETRSMLFDMGWAERATADMANALLGRADGRALLDRAERQCAFFMNVDRNKAEFRSHPLFSDYLRHAAGRDDPERLRNMKASMADWAAGKSDWIRAAQLYSETGQSGKAVEILSRHTEELITSKGEVLSYRQLVMNLAAEPTHVSSLASELALGAIFAGDFGRASELLDQLGVHGMDISGPQRSRIEAIRINVDFGFERFEEVIAEAPRWLERNGNAEPRFRAIVAVALFWSCRAELDTAGAYHALGIARMEILRANAPFLDAWLALVSTFQKREHGQMPEALAILEKPAGEGIIHHTLELMRGAIEWELGHRRQARDRINRHLRKGIRHSVVETAFMGWEAASAIVLLDEGLPAVLALLEEAETTMASRHGERARRSIRLLRSKRILQSFETVQAGSLEAELLAIADDAAALRLGRSFVEMARLQLARYKALHGEPKQAVSLLQPIASGALRQTRIRAWGEASLIYAGALARMEDTGKALRTAWQTIERLAESGLHATASEEHILLTPLLDGLVERSGIEEGSGRSASAVAVVRELARRSGRSVSAAVPVPGETEPAAAIQLTPMELRILSLAAQGQSNGEIAGALMVKISTVKWHMQNIFAKLNVKSRTAAIAEARRAGLFA